MKSTIIICIVCSTVDEMRLYCVPEGKPNCFIKVKSFAKHKINPAVGKLATSKVKVDELWTRPHQQADI